MKVLAICQARMGSTRLPGKVLKPLKGTAALHWVVNAARASGAIDQVVVATSTLQKDDAIVDYCKDNGIEFFRGSETDVLSRFMDCARHYQADIIVRLTCDCPFLDPKVIGEVVQLLKMRSVDYATNTDPPSYPDGLDVEVFTFAALAASHAEATRSTDRDTVTRFMVRNRHRFHAANLVCPLPGLVNERWVLDSPEDYTFLEAVSDKLDYRVPDYLKILKVLDANPGLRSINSKFSRNERFYEGLVAEDTTDRSYATSQKMLAWAETMIPMGAQTFSKSKLQFPEGAAPLFLTHGDGAYCYDVDGNDYIDLVGGLLPNVLGYRDPDVDAAVRDQLSRGISFSLATELEGLLAAKIIHHVPSAEMVRFGKNGSDVTTAAVRLARHLTGRDEVLNIGYHGWHSWTTKNHNGVTFNERSDVADGFVGGNRELPKHIDNSYAAIILEPEFFTHDLLREIRDVCTKHGVILVFDEVITGFRCGLGGLQKAIGVTPDLTTLGKAIANGMPLSVLAGKREFMQYCQEIAFSGTFFGEALSIAAAIATIDKLERCDVPRYLNQTGAYLRGEVNVILDKYNFGGAKLSGEVEINRISFADKKTQALFIQEMARNGVLIIGSHATSFAHKKPELDKIIHAWDNTIKAITEGVELRGEIKGTGVREGQIDTNYGWVG